VIVGILFTLSQDENIDAGTLGKALVSSETHAADENYHNLFSYLRQQQPLSYAEPAGYRPFWVLTRHTDIKSIEANAKVFTNKKRNMLISLEDERRLAAANESGATSLGRVLTQLDGEDHRALRKITQAWFAPSSIKSIEQIIQCSRNDRGRR
jgi:cytochrome P450